MAAIVSSNFRSLNAQNFKEDVTSPGSNVYLGLGKPSAWSNTLTSTVDGTPAIPTDTIDGVNQARANLLGLKIISNSDISHVCPRYNWAAQETFVAWDSNDVDIFERAFYCLTPDFKVYKCLFSPGTAVSDVPTKTQTDPFKTVDNYVWKYMYTILAADSERFLTTSYMPVKNLPEKVQVTVPSTTSAATTIFISEENPDLLVGMQALTTDAYHENNTNITLTGSPKITAIDGTKITLSSNIATATTNVVVTFSDFETTNVLYPQQQVQKASRASATAGGIERIVIGSDLKGSTASFGSGYTSSPTITIAGDGTGATFSSTITLNSDAVSNLSYYVRDDSGVAGVNYTVANVNVVGGGGSGAVARAVIAPGAGHGTNPVQELGGFYIAINAQISGATDSADIVNTQDFRQILLLKNPLSSTGLKLDSTTLNGTPYLKASTGSSGGLDLLNTAALTGDPIITGAGGAKAYVVAVDTQNEYIYYHQNANTGYGTFVASEAITADVGTTAIDLSGNAIALLGSSFNIDAEFDTGSGEILFLENRDPIQRSSSQIEDVKLIIEF